MASKDSDNKDAGNVRLDKWLWAARFFKTRSIAREMVQSGKIQYNNARSKPGKIVELGATITIPQGFDVKEVVIEQISDKRQAAPIAQTLYKETEQSLEKREQNKTARKLHSFHSPRPDNRPDKKQRRELIKMKHQ